MDDLMEFLRARLDEDAEAAQACASAPWEIEIPPNVHVSVQARRDNKWKWGKLGYVATVERDEDRAHIVRHDPERVLIDVEAKRRMIDETWGGPDHEDMWDHHIRLLALPYADHPDYREEWRP